MPRALAFVAIILGLGLIAGPVGYYGWAGWRTTEARGWPQADGRVLKSNVHVIENDRGPREGSTQPSYRPDIVFRYSVNGRDFTGRKVWLTGYDGSKRFDDARAVMDAYPAGSAVKVLYNPDDPTDAALRTAWPRWEVLMIALFGIPWIAGAIYFVRRGNAPPRLRTPRETERHNRVVMRVFFVGFATIAGSVIYLIFFFE